MPFTIVTSDLFTNGVSYDLGIGDHLIVRSTGSVTSLDNFTVNMGAGTSVRVEGSIFSTTPFVAIIGEEGNGMTVDVAQGGSVYMASVGYAMAFYFSTTIMNAGSIASYGGGGILTSGPIDLTNTGQILAADVAVLVNSFTTSGTIVNEGLIRGGTGTGDIFAPGTAVQTDSAAVTIVNRGTIETQFAGSDAISAQTDASAAGLVIIENDGTIRASKGYGINAEPSTISGVSLTNSGVITGGSGAVIGSAVGDVITNTGTLTTSSPFAQTVFLGAGNDRVINTGIITNALGGAVDLGEDDDVYQGAGAQSAVQVDGGAGNDVLTGGAFNDTLYGGGLDDELYGGAGDDVLSDVAGNTQVRGGAGDDVIQLGGTNSTVFGGAGDDVVQGGSGTDLLYGGTGDDTLRGGGGNDVFGVNSLGDLVTEAAGSGNGTRDRVESGYISLDLNVYENVEDATLTGVGALRLSGTATANILTGNVAANVITGDAGNDTIAGAGGADVITGGAGADSLTGGAGADVFVLVSAAETGLATTTRDVITDFAVGTDDMRMIFMASFIGAANFTAAGQVRYVSATGLLSGSTDADAASEWQVQMATGLVLTSADFVF